MEKRPIPGYENYQITKGGIVFGTVKNNRPMRPFIAAGYQCVCLWKNGKRKHKQIHRLIIEAFVGPIPEGMQVNHKNGIKTWNHLDNLEVVTPKQNIQHGINELGVDPGSHVRGVFGEKHPRSKLTDAERDIIRALRRERGWKYRVIAEHFGISEKYAHRLINNQL